MLYALSASGGWAQTAEAGKAEAPAIGRSTSCTALLGHGVGAKAAADGDGTSDAGAWFSNARVKQYLDRQSGQAGCDAADMPATKF